MRIILRHIPASFALASAVFCLSWLTADKVCAVVRQGQSVALSRTVTPNGDNRNDTFIFKCYNPKQAAVTGRIYDLKGAEVAVMKLIIASTSNYYYVLEWNPNSGGNAPGGVYLYQVVMEDQVFNGAVAVIR